MRAREFIIERKKRSKKSRGLGGYFFPGYGFYGGSGDAGEGGGDGGGGGESKQGMVEAMAADQVLDYVKRTHAPDEFNIEYSITDHPEWELKTIPLSQLNLDPDGEAQDPYNRVNWVDDDKVQELIPRIGSVLKSNPIVVDPAGWIIDGNHRAMAAAEAGLTSVPALVPVKQGVTENIPQPGESSGAPKQFGPDAKIQTRQMTVKQIISSVPGLPYYNNVVDDWDAKDYSWGVTKKVIEYATYLKQHPESLSQLPPILVLNGKFEDGAHRVSAIWLLQQRMDPKNPLWANAKLNVQFVKQGVAEGKITLSTDPNWYGATLDNYQASGPVVNIPANKLVGFEPDDKMNQPKSKVNVEKIVAGLKQGAKLPPLLVRKYKNGYQVLDGHHRFWAYKLLGVKSIPAQIVPDSDIEEISKQGVTEGESNDTAISLSKLGKFHPGADSLAEFVPERATARYALHPDKWESTFYSLTNKDSDKLKYYGPKKISIPPGTLVGDMAIANKFYRAKTPEEKQQYAELYKASLQPYPVDVSAYRMPELLIPRQGVAEDTQLPGDFKLMGQNLFLKNLARNLKQRYPDATVKLLNDRVTAYHNEGDDEALSVMGTEVMDSGYIGVGLDDAFTESFQGVLVPTIKQTTEQLLAANPGTRPALFLSTDNWNPDAWTHIASKLGYRLVADDEELDENFADGKKPGRKGLAKRSGVNTKASVSSLRKTAKNSSGEKQRMAHWLANMKAGRAKARKK